MEGDIMSDAIHDKKFPGEGDKYRKARNSLLKAEIELRQKIEDINNRIYLFYGEL